MTSDAGQKVINPRCLIIWSVEPVHKLFLLVSLNINCHTFIIIVTQ